MMILSLLLGSGLCLVPGRAALAAGPYHGTPGPAQLTYLAPGAGPVAGATGATFTSAAPVAISIPNGATQTAPAWTAQCWVKVPPFAYPRNLVAASRNVGGTDAPGSWALGVAYNGSIYGVCVTASQTIHLDGFADLRDNAWHLIALTVSTAGGTSTYQMYLDGAVVNGYPYINGTVTPPATTAYSGPVWVPDSAPASTASSLGGADALPGDGPFVGGLSEVSVATVSQYASGSQAVPTTPDGAGATGQQALYHLAGNPWDSNTTGVPAATAAVAVPDPVLTVGVARPVYYLFNGVGPGAFAPSIAGAAGAFTAGSVGPTFASFTLTPSATGPQTDDGMGAATVSGVGTGLAVTPAAAPVAPVTSPPAATALTAAWRASLDALFARVYNGRYDARLPYALWGDGGADCLAALEADKAFVAAQGGGVLYLPAGRYPAASTAAVTLSCPSGVAVVGDTNLAAPAYVGNAPTGYHSGFVRTVLTYDTTAGYGINPNNTSNALLMRLTLRNGGAPAAQKNHLAVYAAPGSPLDRFALDGVEWTLGDDGGLLLSDAGPFTRFAMENCRLDATGDASASGRYGGTFAAEKCADLTFRNNLYRYPRGRVYFDGGTGGYIGGNQFVRVQPVGPSNVESGGPNISYCRGLSPSQPYTVENNLITVDGPVDQENFGEALLAQGDGGAGTYRNFCDAGTLTGASGTTLTDAAKSWYLTPPQAGVANVNGWQDANGPLVVCMTGGAALGQFRTVTAHTATTITLDSAFSPAPAPGDSYCVTTWVLQDVVVQGNVFYNNYHQTLGGIGAYQGCFDLKYLGNTLVNSGGIVLNGWDDATGFHAPVWNSQISGNTVSNPDGLMLGFVGVQFAQVGAALHGNLAHGNRVFGNTIAPAPISSTATNSPLAYSAARTEGVFQSVAGGTALSNMTVAQQRAALAVLNADAPFPGVLYTVTGAPGALPIPAAAAAVPGAGLSADDSAAVAAGAGPDGKVVLSQVQRDVVQREVLRLTETGGRVDPADPEGAAILLLLASAFHALLPAFVTSAPGGH